MISTTDCIIRLLVAMILGGIIGYERQVQSKSAGLRTHVLVSLGSCLAMIVSINLAMNNYFVYGLTTADPGRIAAQVVSGIGFLGAGTILANKKDHSVVGLTTAASLWAVASLGLVVGDGEMVVAIAATIMIYLVLHVFTRLDRFLQRYAMKHYQFHIVMRNTVDQSRRLGDYFKNNSLSVQSFQSLSDEDKRYVEINVSVASSRHNDSGEIIADMLALGGIVEVRVLPQSER